MVLGSVIGYTIQIPIHNQKLKNIGYYNQNHYRKIEIYTFTNSKFSKVKNHSYLQVDI